MKKTSRSTTETTAPRKTSVRKTTARRAVARKTGAPIDSAKVQEYIAKLPPDARKALKGIQAAIRSAVPKATDVISYGIPAFRLDGKVVIWYAAWKNHCSMYPVNEKIMKSAGVEGYETSKGTIRFPLSDPPSAAVVRRLVKARLATGMFR